MKEQNRTIKSINRGQNRIMKSYSNGVRQPKIKQTARKKINKDLREKVWLKYMKNKVLGKCYCCKIKPIHFTDFEVGHNKAVSKGGSNNINNLRPICRSCNKGMGTKTIEWYRNKYYSSL